MFIINSKKPNNQAGNLPKVDIGNENIPNMFWSYDRKRQLYRQIQSLSEDHVQDFAELIKVSCSYIIKIIQFKLLSAILTYTCKYEK